MSKEVTSFVVENGFNTCYMDSLFMALFYTPSSIYQTILCSDPIDKSFMLLQEMIKNDFIEPIRKNLSVSSETINEIRNYAFVNGWKTEAPEEIFEQHDVNEFYTYLLSNFNSQYIEIKKELLTEAITEKDYPTRSERLPFISLYLPKKKQTESNIKELLDKWLTDNTVDVKREIYDEKGNKIISTVKALCTYRITNMPQVIPISINRFDNEYEIKNKTPIDIMQKVRFLAKTGETDQVLWTIHAIVCHVGDTLKSGHYYSLLTSGSKWLLFDDMSVPCLKEVDMKNEDLIKKVKSECVFVIYKYDF